MAHIPVPLYPAGELGPVTEGPRGIIGGEILDLTAQITDLRGRSAEIKAGGKASAARELVDQKGVVLFLQDVTGEARRLGVSLVSIHPSQEIDKDGYKEISMSLDLKARYRELAEYFRRLEGLSHVVNVRKIRVSSCPDSSSVCSAQLGSGNVYGQVSPRARSAE